MKIHEIFESATGGSTSAGSIASAPGGMGSMSRRPSIFGYVEETPKKKKKSKKMTNILDNDK